MVKSALKADRKTRRLANGGLADLDFDLDETLHLDDREVLKIVGEGLARGTPAFRALSDQIERSLADFVNRNAHPADQNLSMLGEVLSLADPELALLRLAAAISLGSIESNLFACVPLGVRLYKALEVLCDVGPAQASRMFKVGSSLQKCGLLQAFSGDRDPSELDDLLVLNATGELLLTVPFESAAEMAEAVLKKLPACNPEAMLEWPHLERQTKMLATALTEALRRRATGFNILLHGAPGTGKTAFARQLIAQIGGAGFAVDHCDDKGEEASRADRLASLQLSQCFAGQRHGAVLLLDEAEDIFEGDYHNPLSRVFSGPAESKAWINSLLESNAHPVIWISNQVSHLDPAYLRRFSFCLEFPQTPYSLRRKITQDTLSRIGCSPETIQVIAQDERTTPALLASAAEFAHLAEGSGMGSDTAVLLHLDEHARAKGSLASALIPRRTQRFDLRYLNIAGNVTPDSLVQSLKSDQAAAIVFSGPPGTGKTQFAAEIAQRLDRHLQVRTASDINSMWYGESERNVAKMFRQTDPKSQVLFLDEAEILLCSREQGGHRADRAVTAEFLRWLEVFEGTFICATNHPNDLDAALMRRFTFRIPFRPLSRAQRVELYAERALGWLPDGNQPLPTLDGETMQRLGRLELLTPGDFANAARRAKRLGLDARKFVDELEAEHASKGAAALTPIGFV